jgi:hypothetical protein
VGRVRNRHVEGFYSTSCVCQMRPGHSRPHSATVSVTPRTAHGHAVTRKIGGFGHNSMLEVRILHTS